MKLPATFAEQKAFRGRMSQSGCLIFPMQFSPVAQKKLYQIVGLKSEWQDIKLSKKDGASLEGILLIGTSTKVESWQG